MKPLATGINFRSIESNVINGDVVFVGNGVEVGGTGVGVSGTTDIEVDVASWVSAGLISLSCASTVSPADCWDTTSGVNDGGKVAVADGGVSVGAAGTIVGKGGSTLLPSRLQPASTMPRPVSVKIRIADFNCMVIIKISSPF